MDINIISLDDEEAIFDVTGVDPPLANALRRILISEIPTIAIDIVNLYQNTSVIPDEVLCHRLGLIPILANANDFEYKKENEEYNENNSIHFKLHVKCEKKKSGDKEEIINEEVLSSKIVWNPIGNQSKNFIGENIIKVVFDDILVAKLRPGQVNDQ
jgi:DNA-directed RNA polymerases I and III subunit RPAC1